MSMEHGIVTESQEQRDPEMIKKLIEKVVTRKGFDDVRANIEGYESPAKIRRGKDSDEFYIPDVTGEVNGRKSYFELGLKTSDETTIRQVVTKWRLLSNLAAHKNGKLYLAVPRGHMAFTNRILADYPIQAEIVKL